LTEPKDFDVERQLSPTLAEECLQGCRVERVPDDRRLNTTCYSPKPQPTCPSMVYQTALATNCLLSILHLAEFRTYLMQIDVVHPPQHN
jgi:hypothetical protein